MKSNAKSVAQFFLARSSIHENKTKLFIIASKMETKAPKVFSRLPISKTEALFNAITKNEINEVNLLCKQIHQLEIIRFQYLIQKSSSFFLFAADVDTNDLLILQILLTNKSVYKLSVLIQNTQIFDALMNLIR